MERTRYSFAQRLWHWLTVGLIVFMGVTGNLYSAEIATKTALMLHQIAGQLLIVTLIARIITRLRTGAPAPDAAHAGWERALSRGVHFALYATLMAFAVTGYIAASGLRSSLLAAPLSRSIAWSDWGETLTETHFVLGVVLVPLLALHILGALKHHFWDQDNTLKNMWFTAR